MRFQVPQSLDVSDTIIFGLSFKQLLYLGGAGGFMIFLFFFAGGFLPALLLGSPVALLAGLLAFFNFNNQPFSIVLQSIIRFFTSKKMYVWKKEGSEKYVERKMQESATEDAAGTPTHDSNRVNDLNTNLMFDDAPTNDCLLYTSPSPRD